VLENDFVSSRGWVKPGQTYPFTLRVLNPGATPLVGRARVRLSPDGTSFAPVESDVPDVPPGGVRLKVVEARADSLAEDPGDRLEEPVVHGDAHLRREQPDGDVARAEGHTADRRIQDRPLAASTATKLAGKINDPANPGSTFNLYQEISYGQLFPHATVPSETLPSATGWTARARR
jgi:immune inhibitor A